jgi:hypothetical protein
MPRGVEFTEASRKVFEGVIPTISPGPRAEEFVVVDCNARDAQGSAYLCPSMRGE